MAEAAVPHDRPSEGNNGEGATPAIAAGDVQLHEDPARMTDVNELAEGHDNDDDDEEDDEDEESTNEVELGFVARIEPEDIDRGRRLLHDDPNWGEWDGGLVGGRPRWLNPTTIPSKAALACAECQSPMTFVLQIYCPLDEPADAFHRSLYVFCCRNAKCTKQGSGKAFRAQLPQVNAFYPATSNGGSCADDSARSGAPGLCALCGQRAEFKCSACRMAQYCSKEHQKDHWANGHKADCAKCAESNSLVASKEHEDALRNHGSKWLFPQYEVEIDHEPDAGIAANEHEAKLIAEFEQAKQRAARSSGDDSDPFTDDSAIDVTQKDLNEAIGSTAKQDKNYIKFLTRVELAKDQVLRYARWQDNSVLWVHEGETLVPEAVPPCPHCQGPRKFEFQLLPQLLFYLHVDQSGSLQNIQDRSCDWGTLVVYTCAASCQLDGEYAEEYLHYQTPYAGE